MFVVALFCPLDEVTRHAMRNKWCFKLFMSVIHKVTYLVQLVKVQKVMQIVVGSLPCLCKVCALIRWLYGLLREPSFLEFCEQQSKLALQLLGVSNRVCGLSAALLRIICFACSDTKIQIRVQMLLNRECYSLILNGTLSGALLQRICDWIFLWFTGLELNLTRPNDKLPYGGVWLNVGSPSQMIHLMELPSPDPKNGRPQHGGRDRHACVSVKDVMKIKAVFDKAGMYLNNRNLCECWDKPHLSLNNRSIQSVQSYICIYMLYRELKRLVECAVCRWYAWWRQ